MYCIHLYCITYIALYYIYTILYVLHILYILNKTSKLKVKMGKKEQINTTLLTSSFPNAF